MGVREELLLEEIVEGLTLRPAPLDLTDLLAAIQAIPGSPSAEEIAQAIAMRLRFPSAPDMSPSLEKILEALERLIRKPVGHVAGGGVASRISIKNTASDPVPVSIQGGIEIEAASSTEITNDAGNPIPVSGTVTATGPATDAELRATPLPVSGTVSVAEPVSIDDNGGSITVDGAVSVSNFPATQPVSGTVTANAGTGTMEVSGPVTDAELRATPLPVSGTVTVTEPVTVDGTVALDSASLTALETIGLDAATLAALETISVANFPASQAVTGTFWQATQPVSVAATLATKEVRSATPTQSSVGDSATSVTLLSANANRLGATIYNDSTAICYVKLGATASSSSFTVALAGTTLGIGGYYEVPALYTGVIDAIWASDAGGSARITELAA